MGGLWGSFANVCIYRLPQDKGVVAGRSYCPKCKKQISWYDNIPILSYLLIQEEEANPGLVFDHEFIEDKTHGFNEWKEHIQSLDFEFLIDQSGISRELIYKTVKAIAHKKKISLHSK